MAEMKQTIRMLLVTIFLFSAICLEVIYSQRERIAQLEEQTSFYKKQTVVIYQVDNAGGAEMVGKVTDKEVIDGHPTVTVGAYGKFLVTPLQYQEIEIGDDVPEYLKRRDVK